MTETLTIALAQINPTVGDIAGNRDVVRAAREQAGGADLVVCGELAISGYPPEDLVLKNAFMGHIEDCVRALAADTADGGPALLVGAPWRVGGSLFNAALLLEGGAVREIRLKHQLPNYGVFDEKRVFAAGPLPRPVDFKGLRLGVMVCEDMWTPTVAAFLAEAGSDILIVLNGSPYEMDKTRERIDLAANRAAETGLFLVYVNLVGGQDELVFDGASFVVDGAGKVAVQAPHWETAVTATAWTQSGGKWNCAGGPVAPHPDHHEAVYRAMLTGLGDYVGKNGFSGVIIGLSGGVDSALSAAVAVDALGPNKVHCVMMPSPYTSKESLEDAALVAEMLGVQLDEVPIEAAMKAFDGMLRGVFEGHGPDVTEENIQARSRGLVLMAISNKLGYMVLTTGNKSEMSVGYATLYGDMCGGYSVLKDIYKTEVFALSTWRNRNTPQGVLGADGPVMPERVITKPPSAELRPGQIDQDSLPPYEVLDGILKCLIDRDGSMAGAVAKGFEEDQVRRVWHMLELAEYKRR
ncbi:MAG: NAD+ synthase, partial [Rhodospirillales bacterium]